MKGHLAVFGNTKILRLYCKRCKGYSFVIDNTFQCCSSVSLNIPDSYKKVCDSRGKRKGPNINIRAQVLQRQENKCKYCDIKFGDIYFRNARCFISRLNWDHFVPFSFLQDNPYNNWIASCNVCNSIKSSKLFNTVEEVRDYVKYHRKKKGFTYLTDVSPVQEGNEQA